MPQPTLLLVDSFEPSGLLTQACTLASRLPSHDFEPQFAVLRDRGVLGARLRQIAPVHLLGRRHAVDPVAIWKLRRLTNRLRPSVVHAWGAAAATYAAAAGSRPLVVTLGRSPADQPAWRLRSNAIAHRRVSQIVTPSSSIAGNLDLPGVQVITPGIEPSANMIDRGEARAALLDELKMPSNVRVIVVVARLLPRKGVKELIWIADLLRVLRDETRLVVIGAGVERPVLERFASLASTPEHIRFLGARADAPQIIRGAEVLWHAGDEASPPMAVLEAMAAGAPVVADNTVGCRQILVDGENGLLVPARHRTARARATERLLDDPELGKRLAEGAQATIAQDYTAERMARDYAAEYRQALTPPAIVKA